MIKEAKIKISAKGSRKSGEEFGEETACLSDLVDCIEIDFNFPHDRDFGNEMEFLKKLAREKGIKYTAHAKY